MFVLENQCKNFSLFKLELQAFCVLNASSKCQAGQLIVMDHCPVNRNLQKEAEKMRNDLQLYIPHSEDGWFYVKMMSDPETMAYNAPWFPPDGCIPAPESEWLELQRSWIGREPKRFYAFLQRKCDGAFVGDVNYHENPEQNGCDMGIVIYAPERGKGYGKQGLHLLLNRAFKVDGVSHMHNDFEMTREAAYHIHKAVGFRETGMVNGIIQLELTREEYLQDNSIRPGR